jgi:hypothetical protein
MRMTDEICVIPHGEGGVSMDMAIGFAERIGLKGRERKYFGTSPGHLGGSLAHRLPLWGAKIPLCPPVPRLD